MGDEWPQEEVAGALREIMGAQGRGPRPRERMQHAHELHKVLSGRLFPVPFPAPKAGELTEAILRAVVEKYGMNAEVAAAAELLDFEMVEDEVIDAYLAKGVPNWLEPKDREK